MRPLKRPMFKTGGPIKEGVMNGLRDGGVATTMADATGYAGGGMTMPNMRGRVTGPGGYAGIPGKVPGMLPINETPRTRLNIGVPNQGKITQATGKMANFYDKGKTFVKSPAFSEKGIADLAKKYVPKAFGTVKNVGKGILTRFPAVSSALGMEYVTRPNEYEKVLNEQMNYGPYESRFRKSLDFTYRKKLLDLMEKQPELFDTARGITPKKKTDKDTTVIPEVKGTKEERNAYAKKFKEDQDKVKLDKIYNLLGVKRAQANAASKALIDMSRYIDEGGKDVISKKNIGSTISKAIGAFDKRLDKADQLKEAAGLMIAKGEIEKDIYGAKPGTQLKAAQDYQAQFGGTLKDAYKALGMGRKDMAVQVSESLIKGARKSTDLIEAAYQAEGNPPAVLTVKSKEFDNWQKDNEGRTELDYVEEITDRKPGAYIVGTRVVIVDKDLKPSFYY